MGVLLGLPCWSFPAALGLVSHQQPWGWQLCSQPGSTGKFILVMNHGEDLFAFRCLLLSLPFACCPAE